MSLSELVLTPALIARLDKEPTVAGMTYPDAVNKLLNQQLTFLEEGRCDEKWVLDCLKNLERIPVGQPFTLPMLLRNVRGFDGGMIRKLAIAVRDSPMVKILDKPVAVGIGRLGNTAPAQYMRVAPPEQEGTKA